MMPLPLLWYFYDTPLLKHLVAKFNYTLVVIHYVGKHASLLLLLWLKRIIFNDSSSFPRQIGLSLQSFLCDPKRVIIIIHYTWVVNLYHQLFLKCFLMGRLYKFILRYILCINILLIRWRLIFWQHRSYT
jgi:hypothetical protein